MPLFYTKCPKCGAEKKILTAKGGWDSISLPQLSCECGTIMERDAKGAEGFVKEKLDNGAMPRAVERYANIEELKQERLKKADENAGKKNRS